MKKIIRLTESDLMRIVKRVIMEQNTQSLKITKAVFDDYARGQYKTKGSYVILSDGKTYKFSDGAMGYVNECSQGSYTGENLPQKCSVRIKSLGIDCTSNGCVKYENYTREYNDKFTSCSSLGVKSPGMCEKLTKQPVELCSKLGVKSPDGKNLGYCYVATKKVVPKGPLGTTVR